MDSVASSGGAIDIRYAPIATPLGRLYVAYRGRAICWAMVAPDDHVFEHACTKALGIRPIREERLPHALVGSIVNHVTGRRRFAGPLELSLLTPFQRLVLEKTRMIPAGEVRSYRWIAKEIGAERAVRAVGTALAKNPIPVLIPCHRVIRTDGRIGRYSGGGPSMKAKALAIEGADLEALTRLAPKRIRFVGRQAARIFSLPTCRLAPRARGPRAAYFATQRETTRRGYRPCRHCRPV